MSIIPAHEIANKSREADPTTAKIESIMKLIQKRSNWGEFSLVLSEELIESICEQFLSLGYDITITVSKSGVETYYSTCIDWSSTWEGKTGMLRRKFEEKREMMYF